MIGDFLKALGQFDDPRFRQVIGLGIGLTLALLFALHLVVVWLVAFFVPDVVTLPLIGPVAWVDDALSGASILLMLALSVFLMIPVASAFTSAFLDRVAEAVEDRHYPELPPAPGQSLGEALRDTLRFLGVLALANLLALAVYAIMALSVILAPFTPLVFWALNGFLLGREYFQLVAARRLGREAARALLRRHRGQIWLAGTLMTIPLTIPVVNLAVPVFGAAAFTHLFHRVAADRRA